MDSQFIHKEIVNPALNILRGKIYEGANEEYLNAYEHYRHGRNKEALNDCLKAFESMLKAICTKRGWKYSEGDTATKLVKVCFENGLVPSFWESQFGALRAILEGVATGRNRLSGHGQGSVPNEVPDYVVG